MKPETEIFNLCKYFSSNVFEQNAEQNSACPYNKVKLNLLNLVIILLIRKNGKFNLLIEWIKVIEDGNLR